MPLASGAGGQFSRMQGLLRRDREPSASGHNPSIASRNHRLTCSGVSAFFIMYMRHLAHIHAATLRDNLQYFCFDSRGGCRIPGPAPVATGCFRFCTSGQRMLPNAVSAANPAIGNKGLPCRRRPSVANGWFKARPMDASHSVRPTDASQLVRRCRAGVLAPRWERRNCIRKMETGRGKGGCAPP